MTEMPTALPPAAPRRSRRPWLIVLGGCALLLLCGLIVGGAGAGYWLVNRGRATAVQPAVEYILDASPRMALASEGGTRLTVAQGVLAEIVRPADPSLTAGLRVFGTGVQANACQDTDLVVPLALSNQTEISSRVLNVQAGAAADAALGEAMLAAIRDLGATEGPHTLVVITGGQDECNAEAGALIAAEARRAGIKLQTFLVGYQVPESDAEAIRGMVDAAGDTTYLNALDADELRRILEAIQKYVDDPTTTFPTVALGTPAAVAVGPGTTLPPGGTPQPTDPAGAVSTEPAPGTTPGAGGYASQTACDHPYFPLRQGATWTYAFEAGSYTWTVVEVTGDLSNATARMIMQWDDVTVSYNWTCSTEGLTSYDFGNIVLGSNEGVMNFEVINESGAWLLPADQLALGATWDSAYTMQSTMEAGGQSMVTTTDSSQTSTVVGSESVVTDGGAFDALRIDQSGSFRVEIAGLGIPPVTSESTGAMWLAYGVGMVRQETTSAGVATVMTLISYSIP